MGITEGTAPNISFKEHRHEQDPDIIEQHRMWLAESEYREQDELGHPDEDLAEHSLIGMKNVADSLGIPATYYGIRGEVALYEADDSGWCDTSRAILYRYCSPACSPKAVHKKAKNSAKPSAT